MKTDEIIALIPSYLFRSETFSLVVTDLEGKILCVNKVFEKRYNFIAEELIGKDSMLTIYSEDHPICLDAVAKCLANPEQVVRVNLRKVDKNEDIHATTWDFSAFKDSEGNIVGIFCLGYEITETQKLRSKVQEQERILRAIYQSSSDAITFIDENLLVRYCNQAAKDFSKKVFGREVQVGDYVLDFILPRYRDEFESYYRKALQGEMITIEKSDGNDSWWEFSIYPVLDREQNIIGISNDVKDITEKRKKELLLREKQEELEKIIEAIPHSLLIVNEELKIQYVNDEFEKVFGYTESEVLGKSVDFLLPERLREKHTISQKEYLKKGGKLQRKMGAFLPAITKNQQEILINATLNTFSVEGKKFAIAILQDVTEFKKQQDKILEQNIVLQEIVWQQSHEIRRPLANILGLCNLLQNYKDETEENKEKYVEYILQAAKELDEVIYKIVRRAEKIF